MDLEDIFSNKNTYQKRHYKQKYNYNNNRQFNWLDGYNKIIQNKKLRNIIIIGIAVMLVIVTGLIVILFPFIVKIFNYITENGISGLVEMGRDILNKLTSSIKL